MTHKFGDQLETQQQVLSVSSETSICVSVAQQKKDFQVISIQIKAHADNMLIE
jgi:hypothetical protein